MSGRTFGYVRVAAQEGEAGLARQRALVEAAGADPSLIFEDVAPTSLGIDIRPGLASLFVHVGEGDEVFVCQIDRIARHAVGLLDVLDALGNRGATLRSPDGPVDAAHARFMAAVAEAEGSNGKNARASETPECGVPSAQGSDPA